MAKEGKHDEIVQKFKLQWTKTLTIESGLLENFDFMNKDIMEGIDALASLFNILSNAVWNPVKGEK